MKGLKTLAAVVLVSGAAGERGARLGQGGARTSTTSPAGSPQNAKPSHVCPKKRKKGAFFKSLKGDVVYTRLRQVPERQKPLRPSPESRTGDALREQDHLDDPRQARRQLVRQRQESRLLRLHGHRSSGTPLVVVGFDTATADTAACAWRDGEVLHESLLGLSPRGGPRHATGAAGGGRAGGRGGRRLGGGRPDRGRARPRLLHRPAGRDRHRARARRQPRPAGARRLHARRARAGHRRGRRGEGDAAWPSSTAAAARSSPRSTRPAASGSGSRWSAGPEELAERVAGAAGSRRWSPVRGRYDFGTSWPEPGVRIAGRCRSRPPGRRAARLRARGGGGGRGRPAGSPRST